MELRQLRYFLSVADTRSFVSAAGKLFISRQAISKAISQLESELNVELFMRDSNGAFLTPAGVMFYERVRTLVMEFDNLGADMKNYGTRFHQHIRLAFDREIQRAGRIAFHPCDNTATCVFEQDVFWERVVPALGHDPVWL